MTRRESKDEGWVVGAVLGGTALVGGVLLAFAALPQTPTSSPRPRSLPSDDWQSTPTYTEADVEAAARMLASENPRGSRQLQIEQIHTQLRARKPGQDLFDRITAGSGFGPQGERRAGGSTRPVATDEPATPAMRQLARQVLDGMHPSALLGARKFFEPEQQDRALAVGVRARQKQAQGLPLSKQEQRLIRYYRSAEEVRKSWLSDGSKYVGKMDGVEFFT